MKYRNLGNTGLLVSEISLGCEGFKEDNCKEAKRLIDLAEETGINYFDLYTSDPDVRIALGKVLEGRREKFIIQGHICSTWQNGQYKRTRKIDEVKAGFETLLKQLKTDKIEVGMIHYVDSLEDWNEIYHGDVIQYVRQLKECGKISHIGLSSHNPEVALAAVETGEIEVLMFSVNPCYDLQPANEDVDQLWADENYEKHLINMDPQREKLYETCQRLGVGITVMKTFGGGDLLNEELSPAKKALTPVQCIHYALTRPAVSCILAGAHNTAQLKDSLAYEDATDQQRDYAETLSGFPNISWEGHCMYCSHCAPCPKEIDVAMVMKLLNLCKAQNDVPETVREHYEVLQRHASDCIGCRQCESRCPFAVSVTEAMQEAVKVFGK